MYFLKEDVECYHLCLDKMGVSRSDFKGRKFSMYGWLVEFLKRPHRYKLPIADVSSRICLKHGLQGCLS